MWNQMNITMVSYVRDQNLTIVDMLNIINQKSKTNQFHDFVQLQQILDGISYKNVIYWDVIWFLTSAYGLLFTSGDGNYE